MSQLALFKKRQFFPLFWTQCLGAFNDNFLKNALIIMVTFRAKDLMGLNASQIVAVAGAVFVLPIFLFSALAGQVADKFEKDLVIRFIKWFEFAVMILATMGMYLENYYVLLFVLFSMGLHTAFFNPVKYSLLPQHLELHEIVGGTAMIEAGTFIAILLGTIGGGLLIEASGGRYVVSAGLVIAAALGIWSSYLIPKAYAIDPTLKLRINPFKPTLEIFKYAAASRPVLTAIIGISWFWFFAAALLSLFAPLAKDVLMGNEAVVTNLLAIFSVGVAVGALLCERLSRNAAQVKFKLVLVGSLGISFFGFLFYFICQNFSKIENFSFFNFITTYQGTFLFLSLFMVAVCGGLFIVPLYTLMQEQSKPKHRSRIIAANSVLNAFFMVVSSGFLVVLLQYKITIPSIILIVSILNLFAGIAFLFFWPEHSGQTSN